MPHDPRPQKSEAWTSPYDPLLDDAKVLLHYAVQAGIPLEQPTIEAIATAQPTKIDWSSAAGSSLLGQISRLIDKTKPVTAASVRTGVRAAHAMVTTYRKSIISLASVIIPLSLLFFIHNGLADAISQDVKNNNELAVSITSTLNPSISSLDPKARLVQVVRDLPVFASTTRAIAGRARILHRMMPFFRITDETRPDTDFLELPRNLAEEDLQGATKIFELYLGKYQITRDYATRIRDMNGFTVGAVSNIKLPALYALLGAYAFLLRQLADTLRANTFTNSEIYSERLIIAVIAGMVVGLFSNFSLPQTAGLSPLAVAFLVGYASDVFFAFLDTLLRAFTTKSTPTEQGRQS